MASRNSENDAAMFGLAIVMMAAVFMFVFIYLAVAAFTAVLSVICLFALFKPVKIGKNIIQPSEARWFLGRGIIGWFACPFLIITIAPVFGIKLQKDWIIWMMITGYMIGSLGGEYVIAKLKELKGEEDETVIPPQAPAASPAVIPPPERPPFKYASWDDEETGHK